MHTLAKSEYPDDMPQKKSVLGICNPVRLNQPNPFMRLLERWTVGLDPLTPGKSQSCRFPLDY